MLAALIGIPPMSHGITMTSGDVVTFWVTFGVIVALVLVTTIILGITGYRSVQKQSQMKEAERHYEAFPLPQGGEQPQVQAPEEEKILLRR
jgi:hypothetical protein